MCCESVLLIALVGIFSGSAQTIIVCGNFVILFGIRLNVEKMIPVLYQHAKQLAIKFI